MVRWPLWHLRNRSVALPFAAEGLDICAWTDVRGDVWSTTADAEAAGVDLDAVMEVEKDVVGGVTLDGGGIWE